MRRIAFDYYGLYLLKYLQDEKSREGMSVDVSQERAIAVLMDGFD